MSGESENENRLISLPEAAATSPARLEAELNRLGLHFIVGSFVEAEQKRLTPIELIAGLICQSDARMRLALIALFLYRPYLAFYVPSALPLLDTHNQTQLKLFYSAARLLQFMHRSELQSLVRDWHELPDFYSVDLGLSQAKNHEYQLKELAQMHRRLSGIQANWFGTYQHAAQRLMVRLNKEASWAVQAML